MRAACHRGTTSVLWPCRGRRPPLLLSRLAVRRRRAPASISRASPSMAAAAACARQPWYPVSERYGLALIFAYARAARAPAGAAALRHRHRRTWRPTRTIVRVTGRRADRRSDRCRWHPIAGCTSTTTSWTPITCVILHSTFSERRNSWAEFQRPAGKGRFLPGRAGRVLLDRSARWRTAACSSTASRPS